MDLSRLLHERYGITHADVEPLDEESAGLNSTCWWVSVDDVRCYVAKWTADGAVGSLAAGVEAAAIAEASGVETGAAVEALGGDRVLLVDGGSLVLMRHVDGVALREDDEPDLMGRTLARVHAATAGHELALGLRWPWVEPDGVHLDAHPDLRVALTEALAAVEALPALVTGIAHGDPAPEAFLRLDGGRVALIDWAGALAAPLLYDVASAAMYLGGLADPAGGAVTRAADGPAEAMLTAYAVAEGPATPDLEHVATMLRLRWAVQADYFARRLHAAGDRTGTDETGDRQGLADARHHLL